MRIRIGALFSLASAAIALASCSGGGGTAAPFVASLSPSESVTANVTTAGGTLAFGVLGSGATATVSAATVTLPALTASGTVTGVLSAEVPSGDPVPSSVRRMTVGVTNTPLVYLTLTFAQAETLNDTPAFSITFPKAPPSGNDYFAVYGGATQGWLLLSGPATVSGNTMTFASTTVAPPFTMAANQTYAFAIINTGSTAAAASETYTGSKSISWTYGLAIGCACTSPPTPPPATSLAYSVTSTVSIGSSPNPISSASALDVHTSENDASNLETTTFDTDSWIGSGTSGASGNAVLLYGLTQSEPSSANEPMTTTAYASAQVLDEIPETNGASWSNSPQSTISYAYASGDSGTRTVAADGTYTDNETILDGGAGGTATIAENSDGSGALTWPTPAPALAGSGSGTYVQSVTVSAPASNNIVIGFNYSAYAQSLGDVDETLDEPLWYSISPLTFYGETDAVATGVTLPASCTPSNYGTTANQITRTIDQLDTVVGFEETTVFDTYTVNGIPVCLTSNDLINYAYDWQDNQPYTVYFGALGLETQTTTETLILQSASAAIAAKQRDTSASVPASNTLALALESHELAAFSRARTKYLRSILRQSHRTSAKLTGITNQGGRP